MAGYNYRRGMSRNAVDAYRRNLKPISRFTAQDLRDADIHISLAFAKWLAKKKHWTPAERHHTSKFYNKVRFYDLNDLRTVILDLGDEIETLRQRYLDDLRARRPKPRPQSVANTPDGRALAADGASLHGCHSRASATATAGFTCPTAQGRRRVRNGSNTGRSDPIATPVNDATTPKNAIGRETTACGPSGSSRQTLPPATCQG